MKTHPLVAGLTLALASTLCLTEHIHITPSRHARETSTPWSTYH